MVRPEHVPRLEALGFQLLDFVPPEAQMSDSSESSQGSDTLDSSSSSSTDQDAPSSNTQQGRWTEGVPSTSTDSMSLTALLRGNVKFRP
eukprot:4422640-Amphidinium_carterae.1